MNINSKEGGGTAAVGRHRKEKSEGCCHLRQPQLMSLQIFSEGAIAPGSRNAISTSSNLNHHQVRTHTLSGGKPVGIDHGVAGHGVAAGIEDGESIRTAAFEGTGSVAPKSTPNFIEHSAGGSGE